MSRRPFFARRAVTQSLARALRLILPVVVMIGCLKLLHMHVVLPSLGELGHILRSLSPWQWIGALIATGVSFWALGRYDIVAHRHLKTGMDGPQARRAGIIAIALSQTLGFGLVTGAFARWRMLKGLRPLQAAQLTGIVAITFLIALAGVCGVALIASPTNVSSTWLGTFILVAAAAMTAATLIFPVVRIGRVTLRWPSLTAIAALGFWAMIDVVAAGTALWLLLPSGTELPLAALLPAYFLALGVAILSSAPGGAGAFELALCAMLPAHATTEIIAAIVAFRLVYYALPALIAGLCLGWPSLAPPIRAADTSDETSTADPEALQGSAIRPASFLTRNRPIAESAVIQQNGGHIHAFGLNQVALLDSPQASIALFGTISGHLVEVLQSLRTHAKLRNAVVCLYKCSARDAVQCRRAGWRLLRIAQEAVLSPLQFSDTGSNRRQLRRKLRQAERAGVSARPAADVLPIDQMAQIDAAWQAANGGAMGTTMGRFQPEYLAQQRVFIAWHDTKIVGFVSFHHSTTEWCLDLIRLLPDAPDGCCHALIRTAIAGAAEADVPRLSLASVPDHRFAKRIDPGLRRFKTCFAPRWEDRYVAAPSWPHMMIALGELLRLVHYPAPLPHWPASTDDSDAKVNTVGSQSDIAAATTEDAVWRTLEQQGLEQHTQDQHWDALYDGGERARRDATHNEDEENEIALIRRA
ncbi:phosphatidylglycerol lysyltransferase domain-containing protein [Phaeobacter porticola]|uniref:Putative integral membrane protein n=1 Tax=Phaeobacter porticola TaxID=1844006 RepID=A0A1L3I3X6_9RHOB|nr:phosphatidylglycerol lysyltransferase domain-containing protein [Phaeobacter porticola]APG46759.1 putative integral membrane protein [Phaeobacter porticola]